MITPMIAAGDTFDALAFGAVGVVLKVTMLIGVAGMLAIVLRRSSAAARHQVWMLATVSSLFVPVLALVPGPRVQIPARWWQVAQSQLQSQPRTPRPTVTKSSPAQLAQQRPETLRAATPMSRRPPVPVGVQPSALMNANLGHLLPQRPLRSQTFTLNDGRGTVVEFDVRQAPIRDPLPAKPVVVPTVTPPPDDAVNPLAVVAVLWGVGALALLGWRALGYVLLARVVRQSAPVTDATWHTSLQQCCAESGVVRPVRLLSHHSFSTPVTAGWRRPVIILPAAIGATSSERQCAVLAHELAHIRRFDFVTQGIAAIATCVYWFHPLVWLAAARMRAESECAADDRVLERGMAAENYAHHLLALAGHTAGPMPVVGMARITQLEQRLRAMLNASLSRAELTVRRQRLIAAASLVVVVPYASLRLGAAAPAVASPAVTAPAQSAPNVRLPDSRPVVLNAAQPGVERDSSQAIESGVSVMRRAGRTAEQLVGPMLDRTHAQAPLSVYRAGGSDDVVLDPTTDGVGRAAWPPVVPTDTVIEQTIPMESGELITLAIHSGADVIVRGWDQPTARLRATFAGPSWRQAHARIQRTPSGVYVGSVSEREGYRVLPARTSGYMIARVAGSAPAPTPPSVDHRIEVWVPRRTNIELRSSLGAVAIHDVEGEMTGGAQTGSIEVNNVKGRAVLDTKLGDIRVSNSVLSGSAQTGCGTVTTSGVTGSFSAVSQFDPAPYQAQAPGAKIVIVDGIQLGDYCNPRLRRLGALPNRVNENNPYGDIVLDSAPNGGTLSTGRAGSITVRASGGHLSAATSQGNIELSNVRGDATARSASGDITIRLSNMNGTEHHVSARTSNGTVIVELPDSLDARVEAEVVAGDSLSVSRRELSIMDEYGLSRDPSAPRGFAGGPGALAASMKTTRGNGSGRIYVHVTDGNIIFRRVKR